MVIHSGDVSNPQNQYLNKPEVENFIYWFSKLPIKYKVFVAGNHDTSIEKKLINKIDFQSNGIIYLENDFVEIEGLKIWGSPITPTFGTGWAFNKSRAKTHEVWAKIPDGTDIVVVHGPPKGVLDLSYDRLNQLEFCGDNSLKNKMLSLNTNIVCFLHINKF